MLGRRYYATPTFKVPAAHERLAYPLRILFIARSICLSVYFVSKSFFAASALKNFCLAPCDDVPIPWLVQNKSKLGTSLEEVCFSTELCSSMALAHNVMIRLKKTKRHLRNGAVFSALSLHRYLRLCHRRPWPLLMLLLHRLPLIQMTVFLWL